MSRGFLQSSNLENPSLRISAAKPILRSVPTIAKADTPEFFGCIGRTENRIRHDAVMASIRQVIDWNSVQQRLARLESKESTHQ